MHATFRPSRGCPDAARPFGVENRRGESWQVLALAAGAMGCGYTGNNGVFQATARVRVRFSIGAGRLGARSAQESDAIFAHRLDAGAGASAGHHSRHRADRRRLFVAGDRRGAGALRRLRIRRLQQGQRAICRRIPSRRWPPRADGSLWIGTASGLARYRDRRFRTYTTATACRTTPSAVCWWTSAGRCGSWRAACLSRFAGRQVHQLRARAADCPVTPCAWSARTGTATYGWPASAAW